MTLVKDGLIINLPCEEATHEYSLGERIFWFFSGCPCECSIIRRIIENPGWPSLSCQRTKTFGSLNFWFTTTWFNRLYSCMIQPRGESSKFFHYKLLAKYNRNNVKIFYITFIHSFNMICILSISLKLSKFLLDLLEYKASFTWNLVSFGSIMFSFLEPSTKFVVPDMVLLLASINVNSRKYLLSQRIVCVVS